MAPYPSVDVVVTVGTQEFFGEALPDTGYDGAIIVPLEVGDAVLAEADIDSLALADDRTVLAETWNGRVLIEDHEFEVIVRALGGRFIIGLEVLNQMEVCFEFGERVSLRFERRSSPNHRDGW